MRIDFEIPYAAVESCVAALMYDGKKPTCKAVTALLREMVFKGGEIWLTEPTIDDVGISVGWLSRNQRQIEAVSEALYDKIY